MKHYSAATITGATVLVAGLLGGIAGGAFVLSDDGKPSQAPRQVQMGTTGTETDLSPTPAPSTAPSTTLQDGDACSTPYGPGTWSVAEQDCWLTQSTQQGTVASKETATEAADRAEKAADRAEDAADKAQTAPAPTPAPVVAPTPTPVRTPVPTPRPVPVQPPSCTNGDVENLGRSDEQVCSGGHWVSASPNRHCKVANPTEYVASGETVQRQSGPYTITYRCADGQLTVVERTGGTPS